jgi:hypothetical protein
LGQGECELYWPDLQAGSLSRGQTSKVLCCSTKRVLIGAMKRELLWCGQTFRVVSCQLNPLVKGGRKPDDQLRKRLLIPQNSRETGREIRGRTENHVWIYSRAGALGGFTGGGGSTIIIEAVGCLYWVSNIRGGWNRVPVTAANKPGRR